MARCQLLEITRKSTKTYKLIFTKDGLSIDITGWTIYFTVKESMDDTDENAKIAKTITSHANALSGIALIELTTSDTDITKGNYWYAIDYKTDDSDEGSIVTGKLKIKEPILKAKA